MKARWSRFINNLSVADFSVSPLTINLYLSAIFLASCFSYGAYRLIDQNTSQTYNHFVVGNITWLSLNKSSDFSFFYGMVLFFFIFCVWIFYVHGEISRKLGPGDAQSFCRILCLANAPLLIWLISLLVAKPLDVFLLKSSLGLVSTTLLVSVVLLCKPESFWRKTGLSCFSGILTTSLLALATATIGGASLSLALSRICAIFGVATWTISDALPLLLISLMGALMLFMVVRAIVRADHDDAAEKAAKSLVLLGQGLLPLAFFVLVPTPWVVDSELNSLYIGYPLSIWAFILLAGFIVVSYGDLYRCGKTFLEGDAQALKLLSPLCLVGGLLLLKVKSIGVARVSSDDYHTGELLTSWWSVAQHNLIPFADFDPSRGLVNYIPGALNSLLFDGTGTSLYATYPFWAALFLCICLPVFAAVVGNGYAFFAFLVMPLPTEMFGIHYALTASLCIACIAFVKLKPAHWLMLWATLGTFLVLFAVGQGGLWVVATSPLGIVAIIRSTKDGKRQTLTVLTLYLSVSLLLAFITPLGEMVLGAIRYGLEQSSNNAVAHGTKWAHYMPRHNKFLHEIMRTSWLWTTCIAGVLLLRWSLSEEEQRKNRELWVFALPILILTALFIVRAAGRIDLGTSRFGIASVWSLSMLLPMLLVPLKRAAGVATLPFYIVLITGALIGNYYYSFDFEGKLYSSADIVYAEGDIGKFVNGKEWGLPNLGHGLVNNDQFARINRISEILDRNLLPNETYLDLTNRNAHYFYLDRLPPVASTAFYNLPLPEQQLRAVSSLANDLPPLVLLEADNINWDGGPLSLRSNALFRFLVFNYEPRMIDGMIWLFHPDSKATMPPAGAGGGTAKAELFDRSFVDKYGRKLYKIPIAWGRSYTSLSSRMQSVLLLTNDKFSGEGDFSLTLDLSQVLLDGRDAGLLSFNFAWDLKSPCPINLSWTTVENPDFSESRQLEFIVENGRMIVPLDTSAVWLTAKNIDKMRFRFGDLTDWINFEKKPFDLSQVEFSQRIISRQVDNIAARIDD